ncbi:MAG: hypothetical protein IIC67_04390 [Thaumarchaeota archaeon]|nr:hypothetical protein [Nitrososphaerota archaeon]
MPTISANVSKKELDAIREYANACGETMSNLIRKVLLTDATFMNFYSDSNEFRYCISTPDNLFGDEEDKILIDTYNRIRRILGLQEQSEI